MPSLKITNAVWDMEKESLCISNLFHNKQLLAKSGEEYLTIGNVTLDDLELIHQGLNSLYIAKEVKALREEISRLSAIIHEGYNKTFEHK